VTEHDDEAVRILDAVEHEPHPAALDEPDPGVDVVLAVLEETDPGGQAKRPSMIESVYRAVDIAGFLERLRPICAEETYVIADDAQHVFNGICRPGRFSHLRAASSDDLGWIGRHRGAIACRYA